MKSKKTIKVAYQGLPGCFSHLASLKFVENNPQHSLKTSSQPSLNPQLSTKVDPLEGVNELSDTQTTPLLREVGGDYQFFGEKNFDFLFKALDEGKADLIVVPMENSLAGSVVENFDLLLKYDFFAIGEVYLKVEHNLLGFKNPKTGKKPELKKVYSHYKALEQCLDFFRNNPDIEKVSYFDTAGSAKFVADSKNPEYGAIASKEASEIYGLDILEANIEDNSENYTRFLVFEKTKPQSLQKSPSASLNKGGVETPKCSLVFNLKHESGSLLKALKVLADYETNLTKIESRPVPGKMFEYFFYVDFEMKDWSEEKFSQLIEDFEENVTDYKILGLF